MTITRNAEYKDLEEIYHLVLELAIYENAEKEVLINLNYYQKEFNKGTYKAIVAEEDGIIQGVCIYYLTYSTWKGRMMYLEDFVVKEKYRQKGVGQLLFDYFIQEAKKEECLLVKWQVLDWNEPAIHFYKKNNADIEKGWWNGKIIFHKKP